MTKSEQVQKKVEKAKVLMKEGLSGAKAAEQVGLSYVTLAKYKNKRTRAKSRVAQVFAVPNQESSPRVIMFYGTPAEISNLVKELA